MAVRIIRGDREAVMYCSTTDWAFGPVFNDDDEHDAEERAESFLRWFNRNGGHYHDPRELTDSGLESKYNEWLRQEADQWKSEEKVIETDDF